MRDEPCKAGMFEGDGQPLRVGVRLCDGRFEVVRELGAWLAGRRYRALDRAARQTCVVTCVDPGDRCLEHINPGRFTASPDHPLVQLSRVESPLLHRPVTYGFFQTDPFVLHQEEDLDRRGCWPEKRALTLSQVGRRLQRMTQALRTLHDQGLAYGPVCPLAFGRRRSDEGILVDAGALLFRYLLMADAQLGAKVFGLDDYLSPEGTFGEAPSRVADVFSLGVIFYEMLTGTHPFRARTMGATVQQILSLTPPPPTALQPHLPLGVERLLLSMLQKDPDRRPHSATGVLAELLRVMPQSVSSPSLDLGIRSGSSARDNPSTPAQPSRSTPNTPGRGAEDPPPTAPHLDSGRPTSIRSVPKPGIRMDKTSTLDRSATGGEALTARPPSRERDREFEWRLSEAATLARTEEWLGALRIYLDDLTAHPEEEDVWLGIAWCLLGLERWGELETHLSQAVRNFPRLTDLRAIRALMMFSLGQREEAMVLSSQLLDQHDPSELPWLIHAIIHARKDWDRASLSFREAWQRRGKDWWLLYQMGSQCLRDHLWREAQEYLQRAYGMKKDFYLLPFYLGRLADMQGDLDRSERYYRASFDLNPDFEPVRRALGYDA